MTEHTETPWGISTETLNPERPLAIVHVWHDGGEDGESVIAEITVADNDMHNKDAAFIVKAVNSHDALVEVLKDMLRDYDLLSTDIQDLVYECCYCGRKYAYCEDDFPKDRLCTSDDCVGYEARQILEQAE